MNLIGFKGETGGRFYLRLRGSCRLLSHSSAILQPQVPKATGQGISIRASAPYTKAIGKGNRGECFGGYNSLKTSQHFFLHCKHYAKEKRGLAKALHKPRLTLPLLLNTSKGSAALLGFLKETEIATAR
jgi:hypothetical protein